MEFEQLEKAALNNSAFSQSSLVRGALGREEETVLSTPPVGDCVRGVEGEESDEERGVEGEESDKEMDKTLTPSQAKVDEVLGEFKGQSLAVGVVFSDDEEWNSFSHGSPRQRGPSPLTSPVKQREDQVVSSTPITTSPTHHSPPSQAYPTHHSPPSQAHPTHHSPPSQAHPTHQSPPSQHHPPLAKDEAPPPPSALAARLFPALRRERERVMQQQRQQTLPRPIEEQTTPTVATPPRYPSEAEVRERLCQLETEIERFRTLNSKLEQQNKEKEKV